MENFSNSKIYYIHEPLNLEKNKEVSKSQRKVSEKIQFDHNV